jgi:peptidoglycan/LPS O-acetylase OafA/YrhL
VDLFFVLSGFVLARPYLAGHARKLDYPEFMVRRVFRLYPALWAALAVSLALRAVNARAGLAGLSTWAREQWADPLSAVETVKTFMLAGPGFNTHLIDPPVWSLAMEMSACIVLPLFFAALARRTRVWVVAAMAASFLPGLVLQRFLLLPLFVAGAVLAAGWVPVQQRLAAMRRPWAVVYLAVALACYSCRSVAPGLPLRLQDMICGAGGLLLVAAVPAIGALRAVFRHRLALLLGDLSYALYLLHLPVLVVVTSRLYPATGSLAVCVLAALAVTLAASWVMYRGLELPMIAAGRVVSARVSAWLRRAWPGGVPAAEGRAGGVAVEPGGA